MEIYNEDCLEGMKRIPDGAVDMILTDLPYGTTEDTSREIVPIMPMWKQFLRIVKFNAAIVLFSQMPFRSDLIQSQRKLFRYEVIWNKPKATGILNAKKCRCVAMKIFWYFIDVCRLTIRNGRMASLTSKCNNQ